MTEEQVIGFAQRVAVRGPDDCWLWRAGRDSAGYGHVRWYGRAMRAHRVAFFLAHGRWPEPCGLHRCDIRLCCNPAHLFEGSRADNVSDMVAKGRDVQLFGAENGRALLTEAQVLEIRALRYQMTRVRMASRFGVAKITIDNILQGKTWRHLLPKES